ncbi:type VI secretion system protein TssA [Paraneptunicella aestuarii]|uniref:type VI secretion system protein TssA n=1 Tax=Paraneptunicella aestuarii TaxID=2831148 RepID=UPI001E3C5795|nr:type VI secretion system protein TssA [Paraneptunicella aestuarii]UAA37098.1 type VI secretion system protein TssA [Paraneptunicella aestuarii]
MSTEISVLEKQFEQLVGVPIESLLQDIDKENRYGSNLKYNGVYSAINAARTADDPSVPMGQWEHDLNTADWEEVKRLALDALSNKSKDLQIAIWLMEAMIHQNGFSAIGPCFHLLHQLTENFWDGLYPQIEDENDLDYRTNLIAWVNDKLQPVIKLLPLTFTRNEQIFTWADWEMAAHFEQLPADQKKALAKDYVQTNSIVTAIIATPIEFYKRLFKDIDQALSAIDNYSKLLDKLCADEAPSLLAFRTLLQEIYETLYSHVKHRAGETNNASQPEESSTAAAINDLQGGGGNGSGPIKNRMDAYARLAEAAEYLAMDDPHSPVPYLVYKAIEWGQLNTAELYQELFVQYQGQLNIFDLLGLELDPKQQKR